MRSRRVTWLRRAGLFVLSLVCARVIIDLVGAIDWDAVRGGIEHLHAWQLALLVALVLLRQVLNALPLVFFIDGLSVFRAAASDQGSTLMSMIAPPTSDAVFRIAVMRSWGIDVERAVTGSTCNALVFYIARWIAPLFGVLLLAGVRFDTVYGLSADGSLLISCRHLRRGAPGHQVTTVRPTARPPGRHHRFPGPRADRPRLLGRRRLPTSRDTSPTGSDPVWPDPCPCSR